MKIFQTTMFRNIDESEIEEMQACSCMRQCSFERNAVIFHMGDIVHEIGIVLAGNVNIEKVDLYGNKSILSNVSAGQIFAETYAFCQEPMMVDAVAAQDCEILFLDLNILLSGQNTERPWYSKMLENMLRISVHKNLTLSNRIFFTASKTIRGRLLAYLSTEAVKNGSTTFQIPFNRQQLADYLNVDRSALSKELCRMRDENMIEFYKNQFILKHLPE